MFVNFVHDLFFTGPFRALNRINEAHSRDPDQLQRFGAWDLETCPKKSSRNTVVSCPAGFQGHAWKSNTRYFLYEVCFLVGVSGREGLGVTSVQVGDVWRLLKDWQWEGLPTATAKSFRGIWLQSMDCQWLSHMVFQTPAQVIVILCDSPFHHGNSEDRARWFPTSYFTPRQRQEDVQSRSGY